STSALIDEYCALRSSNGTFMPGFLFQLSVGSGAGAELCRQWQFIVEIDAAKDTRLGFLVAIAAFGTPHHAVPVRRLQPVAVPAHPSNLTRGIPHHQGEVRHVLRDGRSGADEPVAADRHAADDGRVRANRASALQPGRLV